MKSIFWSITISVLLFSCESNEPEKIKVVRIKADQYNKEKNKVAAFIENYLNLAFDSSLQIRNNHWDSEVFYYMQDRFLIEHTSRELLTENPPKILGIRQEKASFYVNLLFEKEGRPLKIIELKLLKDPLGRFYFVDRLSENLKQYQKRKIDGHTFYYSPESTIDTIAEKEVISYNRELANFFERPQQNLRVITCENIPEYAELQSFIYVENMNLDYQHGGLALPNESLYFSLNGSPSYPHEMAHLYSSHLDSFYWFDEGLATYLGGSVEQPLDYHIQKIADTLDEHDFSTIPKNKRVDELTSYKYAIGGLFIKLAMEEYGGKEAVFKLMSYGKTEEDFYKAIKNIFGVDKSELDQFVKTKIRSLYL